MLYKVTLTYAGDEILISLTQEMFDIIIQKNSIA